VIELKKWEQVATDTYRLKIEEGWLYRWHNTTPVFVPKKR
jgi:hypothetical protein